MEVERNLQFKIMEYNRFSFSENGDAGKKNMGFNSTLNEPKEIWWKKIENNIRIQSF